MRGSKLSQAQKIITLMAKRKDSQAWFIPPDFMDPNLDYLFVGYEASARFSELAKKHPEMMESRPSTKYVKRRIRWESMDQWFGSLPKDLRYAFHRTGVTNNVYKYDEVVTDSQLEGFQIDESTDPAGVRPPTEPMPRLFDLPPDKPKRNIMI